MDAEHQSLFSFFLCFTFFSTKFLIHTQFNEAYYDPGGWESI